MYVYIELMKDIYILHQQFDESPQDQHQEREIPYRPIVYSNVHSITYSRSLTWKTKCLRINEDYLSHLRLANDMLMCASTPHELQEMLQELANKIDNQESDNVQIEAKNRN